MQAETDMKKNVLWNTVGSVFYSLCQWLMTVVIVYLTSDYEVIGTLGLTMTITNSFTTISSFGMRSFQVSDTNHQFENEQYIMSRRLTAVLAYLLCGCYALVVHCTLTEWICIMLYMILRIIESTEDVYQGVLQRCWRFDIIGKSYIMRGGAQILLFVAGFYVTKRLEWTFLLMILSNLLILYFYDIRYARKIAQLSRIKWDRQIILLLKACSGLVIYHFLIASLATTVRVDIRAVLDKEALGIYSTIASPTVIVQLVASVIFSPFLPYFSDAYYTGDKKRFQRYIRTILLCIAGAFIMVNIAGIVLGKWGLQLLYNADVASHYELLLPLIWCTFFAAGVWMFAGMLIAMRQIKYLLGGVIGAFLLNFSLGKGFIQQFGLNGASYSQALAEILLMLFLFLVVIGKVSGLKEEE